MDPYFQRFAVYPIASDFEINAIKFGQNKQQIILLYNSNPEQDEMLIQFLGNIIKAVGYDLMEDTCFLKIPQKTTISFAQIQKEIPTKFFIVFGRTPSELGIHINSNLYQPFVNLDTTFLFADELQEIYEERQSGGKQKSSHLWKALKSLFK